MGGGEEEVVVAVEGVRRWGQAEGAGGRGSYGGGGG